MHCGNALRKKTAKIYSIKWALVLIDSEIIHVKSTPNVKKKEEEINQWWKYIYYSYTQIKVVI